MFRGPPSKRNEFNAPSFFFVNLFMNLWIGAHSAYNAQFIHPLYTVQTKPYTPCVHCAYTNQINHFEPKIVVSCTKIQLVNRYTTATIALLFYFLFNWKINIFVRNHHHHHQSVMAFEHWEMLSKVCACGCLRIYLM